MDPNGIYGYLLWTCGPFLHNALLPRGNEVEVEHLPLFMRGASVMPLKEGLGKEEKSKYEEGGGAPVKKIPCFMQKLLKEAGVRDSH